MSTNALTLAPNSSQTIDFSITVPSKANVGEHNGCIAIQDVDQKGEKKGGIMVYTRQAVRVALTIPGDLKKEVTLDEFTPSLQTRNQHYPLALKNTGTVSADVDIHLTLKSIFGQTLHEHTGQIPSIPDSTLKQTYSSEKNLFWGGWYVIELQGSYDKRPGVFGSGDPNQQIKLASRRITMFLWPSPPALAIIGGGIILIIALLFLISRRQ